ncbi:MAG: hypothetical protein JW783_11070 [Bacteroidales bacterium]|nr:hypothetical protein [Bacteroidales bacterium]MBN2748348.1 hypothetical protein [Bacteroidales bacterium]
MRFLFFNEDSLSRLLFDAKFNLEVSDGQKTYQIPIKSFAPKSTKHFVAKTGERGNAVVLKYNAIKSIKVDNKQIDCVSYA